MRRTCYIARGPFNNYKSPDEVRRINAELAELQKLWADKTRRLVFSSNYAALQLQLVKHRTH